MTTLLTSTDALWAAVLVVLLPVLIIGAGEVQERLRQRGSLLEKPVATFTGSGLAKRSIGNLCW